MNELAWLGIACVALLAAVYAVCYRTLRRKMTLNTSEERSKE